MSAIRSLGIAASIAMIWGVSGHPPRAAAQAAGQRQTAPAVHGDQVSGEQVSGKDLFVGNCSRCHGLDATGGDGPNIQRAPATLGDEDVTRIIGNGVPGTGMPAFGSLNDTQRLAIIAYLRSLGRPAASSAVIHGDPAAGKKVYDEQGCAKCHIVNGEGGSLGPELSQIGSARGPDALRSAVIDPGAALPRSQTNRDRGNWVEYLMFRATAKDGHAVEGMRVSADTFTIVLEDAKGNFHSVQVADLRALDKEPGKSFMPSYQGTLSSAELDDLVAYLASLKGPR